MFMFDTEGTLAVQISLQKKSCGDRHPNSVRFGASVIFTAPHSVRMQDGYEIPTLSQLTAPSVNRRIQRNPPNKNFNQAGSIIG